MKIKPEMEKLTEKEVGDAIDKILTDNGYKLDVNFIRETVLGNGALIYNIVIIKK